MRKPVLDSNSLSLYQLAIQHFSELAEKALAGGFSAKARAYLTQIKVLSTHLSDNDSRPDLRRFPFIDEEIFEAIYVRSGEILKMDHTLDLLLSQREKTLERILVSLPKFLEARFFVCINNYSTIVMMSLFQDMRNAVPYTINELSLFNSQDALLLIKRIQKTRDLGLAFLYLAEVISSIDYVLDKYSRNGKLEKQLANAKQASSGIIHSEKIDFEAAFHTLEFLQIEAQQEQQILACFIKAEECKTTPNFSPFNRDLFLAVSSNNHSAIRAFLNQGVHLNCMEPDGKTLLGYALEKSSLETIEFLLQNGIDPNFTHGKRKLMTSLHYCLTKPNSRKISILKLLLQYGACLAFDFEGNININEKGTKPPIAETVEICIREHLNHFTNKEEWGFYGQAFGLMEAVRTGRSLTSEATSPEGIIPEQNEDEERESNNIAHESDDEASSHEKTTHCILS